MLDKDNSIRSCSSDLVENDYIEERDGQKRVVVNEWEKLTAPSNRRLNVKGIDTPLIFTWSIDRLTIVGKLQDSIIFYNDVDVFVLDFEQLMMINEGQGNLESAGRNAWVLLDQYGENVAYIEMLKFQKGYGRIDFNPNKIKSFLVDSMKHFIHKLFLEPHFSRADIACDVIDIPNDFITQYRIIDPVSFRPIYGRSGALETAYWGSRSSERQVRMYNKKLEQKNKKKIIPKEIKTWWRLELQLRRGKASDWHSIVNESLDSFCSPHFLPVSTKAVDRVMIDGLFANHSNWELLSRPTKYKYRNLLKQESQNDILTQYLKSTFSSSSDNLKKELDTWLLGLDVTDENFEI